MLIPLSSVQTLCQPPALCAEVHAELKCTPFILLKGAGDRDGERVPSLSWVSHMYFCWLIQDLQISTYLKLFRGDK